MFWHNLWVVCGRPRSEAVADVNASYHYADRRVALNERDVLNERFAESILNDDSHDFGLEFEGLRSTKSCPSSMVDDFTAPALILHLFLPQSIKNCTQQRRF